MEDGYERGIVIFGTVMALIGCGYEIGVVPTAVMAGIGLALGVATLPWQQRLSMGEDRAVYLCGWIAVWPIMLAVGAWKAFAWWRRNWYDYLARREYERQHHGDRNGE